MRGLSSQSLILKACLAAESALLPRIASTESHGATLSNKKTKLEISHSIIGAKASLVIEYFKSDLDLFMIVADFIKTQPSTSIKFRLIQIWL